MWDDIKKKKKKKKSEIPIPFLLDINLIASNSQITLAETTVDHNLLSYKVKNV